MRERYKRNIDLTGIGVSGQRKLAGASVLVIGAGGLGSAALPYLAGAGVGHIAIVDGDEVERTNLQRQVIHTEVGANKARSAASRLRALNPEIEVEVIPGFVGAEVAADLFRRFDLILDCTDDFATKLMISGAAETADKPLVWASAVGWQGQASVFGVPDALGQKLYLQDLYSSEQGRVGLPTANTVGVLGPGVGVIGSVQAAEAIKIITGAGQPLVGRVLLVDLSSSTWDILPLRKVTHD